MLIPRLIPCLLVRKGQLIKTVKFRKTTYLGDPLNAIRIFNKKEADELILLDIDATIQQQRPNFALIEKIASECFMPVTYGGGIQTMSDAKTLLEIGTEKICVCSKSAQDPDFIRRLSEQFGSQSIIACLDVKKNFFGKYEILSHHGKVRTGQNPLSFALCMQEMGAGELLINCIDRDGMMNGFDIPLTRNIADSVSIPVIACGGAGTLKHCNDVIKTGGASSAAAGSLFVFWGKKKAVLINYPDKKTLEEAFHQPL